MECFKCEVSGTRALLFDAISGKGIVKICEKCAEEEDIPVVRPVGYKKEQKVDLSKLRKPQKRRSVVYERLSKMSGVDMKEHERKNLELAKQEISLKDIVEENLKKRVKKEHEPKPHLVDNFHWIIMRARRTRKLTAEKLAMEIEEPALAVKMAEKGVLPADDKNLIEKLEMKLRVKLIKDEFRIVEKPVERLVQGVDFKLDEEKAPEAVPSKIDFKSDRTKMVTISDLQEMKKKKEQDMFEPIDNPYSEEFELGDAREDMPEFRMREEKPAQRVSQTAEGRGKKSYADKKDLTDKEIDDILFGRG